MAKKVTTLFIRDDTINLLVVEGKRVKQWASLPLEPELVNQGLIVDEDQVAGKIKELFKLEKVSTSNVITGLSGLNSLYRLLSLPDLPEAVIAEAILREARRVIPVPLDEVYLAYQILPAPKGERRVFLTAFPRNVADTLIRTLQQAGIELYIMDLAPLALCRTLDEPRSIIINARLDYLDIIVMADRLPQLIRRLAMPTEAESLAEQIPTISEELDRTVTFYNSSHQEEPIDSTMPVFVCGDLAEIPDSWQSLVGRLNYSVSPLPSPLEFLEGFNPNEFMVNIGLALKELSLEKWGANSSLVNFNALPEVYQAKPMRVSNIAVPIGITVGIILLACLGFLIYNSMGNNNLLRSELTDIQNGINQTRGEIATLQEQIGQIEAGIEPVETITNILNTTLTSLEEGREVVDENLSAIVNLSPGNIDLTNINHEGDTVTVNGISPKESFIFNYARDLRSCERHFTVIISSITAHNEEGGFDFVFLLKHGG
ncbi:MAG TPA: pilus assembly protein PilM [Dehalococcoidia bacterium]|nr:pilus assembly protein PilM [Dehalococcoidia bacterium]